MTALLAASLVAGVLILGAGRVEAALVGADGNVRVVPSGEIVVPARDASGASRKPPTVAIVAPKAGTATAAGRLKVTVRFRARSGRAADRVRGLVLTLNGSRVAVARLKPARRNGTRAFTIAIGKRRDGAHTLRATASSAGSRRSGKSAPVRFLIDRTAPDLSVSAPADGTSTGEATVQVQATATDRGSGVADVTCNGVPAAPAGAEFTCSVALAVGANAIAVHTKDRIGNARETSVSVTRIVGGLGGSANAPALGAVTDVVTDEALVEPAEVTDGVVRTQLQLVFRKDATVGQVNDLLRRIGGRIVSSRAGVAIAVVEVPDPGSLAAHQALLASLANEAVLRDALPAFMPPPDALPEHIGFTPAELAFVRHQLAVRGHAAWNARAALEGRTRPTLVLADHFGDGPPGIGTDIGIVPGDFANNNRTSDHGYMVLGIAAGAYDAVGAGDVAAEGVTGLFPARLQVRAADILSGLSGGVLHDRMLELVENAPGDVVLNTSLGGWPCTTPAQAQQYCTEQHARDAAEIWIEKVRGTDPNRPGVNLEDKFVHVTSAGNIEAAVGPVGARVNSEWAAATLLSGLTVPNLTNTVVVENFRSSTTEPFRPACPAPSSELGGTVAGIGFPVHSFNSPTTARTFADGGTSAATPQVAALAAFVWALAPGLTPANVAGLVERTTRNDDGCGEVIDAYAAVLAADVGNASLPVRRAILDVADANGEPGTNGRFDGNDLTEWLDGFEDLDGMVDYGPFDLNGDGVTRGESGSGRRDRFDLNVDGAHGVVTQDIEGVPVRFDERSLTDENILCHSAYGPLWLGPLNERRDKLGLERCVNLDLDHTFPDRVRAGNSNTLTISASSLAIVGEDGERMPVEDVFLQLEPSPGLTLGSESGSTNGDGLFATTATLAQGQTALSIDITAFDRQGGRELASDTVTAQVDLPGVASIDGVTGEVSWQGGAAGENLIIESSGGWSLSGAGGGTSVSATASLVTEGTVLRYRGSGTIRSTWGGSGGASGVIASYVSVTVSGGPVRWFVTQTVTGALWPSNSIAAGCYVNNVFTGIRSGSRGGILDPGTHEISFNCGAGAGPDFPSIDGALAWELTIGD